MNKNSDKFVATSVKKLVPFDVTKREVHRYSKLVRGEYRKRNNLELSILLIEGLDINSPVVDVTEQNDERK